MNNISLDELSSLSKRRGFIYQGSDIYGGLAGTWDYGPLGVMLKRNIENLWWQMFVEETENMFGVDASILMNQSVWKASGHVDTFNDPLVEDTVTKKRYRLDHLLEDNGLNVAGHSFEQMVDLLKNNEIKSPEGNALGYPAQFNLMFKTNIGPIEDDKSTSYLRPETAQGIFTNFKNIVDTIYPDMPFGIAQIGKAFRNEISPREFVFRVREMEQMEVEYFVHPNEWNKHFDFWIEKIMSFYKRLGLDISKIHQHEIEESDRAHYSKRTIDFEYDYPHGRKELAGLAYRTDYDLQRHQEFSGKNLTYRPKDGGEPFIPHVIEPSMGIERLILALLDSVYHKDTTQGEERIYLAFPENIAPIKFCVSPLLKNKPELVAKAREVYDGLRSKYTHVTWDDNGNIGKRYRRQDEIGTPYCVVVDFDSLSDQTVTIRFRDTTEQKRVKISEL